MVLAADPLHPARTTTASAITTILCRAHMLHRQALVRANQARRAVDAVASLVPVLTSLTWS